MRIGQLFANSIDPLPDEIFAELNIRSRTQLHRVLAADRDGAQRA
jgi:hypothetical protein